MMRILRTGLATLALAGAASVLGIRADRCGPCLLARFWPVPADDWQRIGPPTFPESAQLATRGDLGVAFSGGGTRSASASLGQLRGLQRNGWLKQHVRYISAVSGGGWAAVPFTFSKLLDTDLLGQPLDPSQIDRQTVASTANGAMALAIANSSLAASGVREAAAILSKQFLPKNIDVLLAQVLALAGQARREPQRLNKTYARMLGGVFIDPIVEPGTPASTRLFSWDDATVAEMNARNPGGLPGNIVTAALDRPFLIVSGTMMSARSDYGYPLLMPVEYTPLYTGVRQSFGGRFGGSYVWSWAYDTREVGQTDGDFVQVRRDADRVFSLADVVASTGAAPQLLLVIGEGFPANVKTAVQRSAGAFPSFTHFSVRGGGGAPLLTSELPHGDGGFGDNLGVAPLLARQVHNVLAFINASTPYFQSDDDLRALFFPVGPPDAGGDKTHSKVFDEAAYSELIRGFEQQRTAGKPLVYCGTNWNVHANAHFNVRQYSGLNICWFYNGPAPAWQAALKEPVRALVTGHDQTSDGKNFDDFPWFRTFGQNKPHVIQLTKAQVNLLSNLTEWIVSNDDTVQMIRRALSEPLRAPAATEPAR